MPYGTVNADKMTTSDGVSSSGLYGFKNRIINGAMVIDQRNAGASKTLSSSTYTLDRWSCSADTSTTSTVQQSSTAPTGFKNSFLWTTGTGGSPSSAALNWIYQVVEGFNYSDFAWGTASASAVTLSFWVRSSLTGTFGGSVANGSLNYSYPFTFTISSANTFEYKTITIAGPTSGTWNTTNTAGIYLFFDMGMGSNYRGTAGSWAGSWYAGATGDTNVIGTTGATFYITGVQLEKGSTATSFDYRPYGTELQLCQRYCVNYNSANASSTYFRYGIGENESTTTASQILQFPVPMRTGPTLTTTGTAANYAVYSANAVVACTAVPSIGTTSPLTAQIGWGTASVLTAGRASSLLSNNNNTSYLIFSAEL